MCPPLCIAQGSEDILYAEERSSQVYRPLWETHIPQLFSIVKPPKAPTPQMGCLTARKPLDGDARCVFGHVGQVAAVGTEADGASRLIEHGKGPHAGQALQLEDAHGSIHAARRQQPVKWFDRLSNYSGGRLEYFDRQPYTFSRGRCDVVSGLSLAGCSVLGDGLRVW